MFISSLKFLFLITLLINGTDPIDDDPQDIKVALERVKILEKVEHNYEAALKGYEELLNEKRLTGDVYKNAYLGMGRCLVKLGRYDQAIKTISPLTERDDFGELQAEALEFLKAVKNLKAMHSDKEPSSMDILVYQLIEGIGADDDEKRENAAKELLSMGTMALPMLKKVAEKGEYFQSVGAFQLLLQINSPEVVTFYRQCCESKDKSLRKRALDGAWEFDFSESSHDITNAFALFLKSSDPAFRKKAIQNLVDHNSFFSEHPGEMSAAFLESNLMSVLNLCKDQDWDVQYYARQLLVQLIISLTKEGKAENPVPISSKTMSMLREHYANQLRRIIEGKKSGRERTWSSTPIEPMYMLGKSYGDAQFLKMAFKLWFKNIDIGYKTAVELGPESIKELVGLVMASEKTGHVSSLSMVCPKDVFLTLPEKMQQGFLRHLGQYEKNAKYPSPYWKCSWSPDNWAALMQGLLQNNVAPLDKKDSLIQKLCKNCPDVGNALCMDVLTACIQDKEVRVASIPLYSINILDDLSPALVMHLFSGFFQAHPREFVYITHLFNIPKIISSPGFKEWFLSQNMPGFYNYIAKQDEFVISLLLENRSILTELWFKIGPEYREDLFHYIYLQVHRELNHANQNWFLPVFKEWKYDNSFSSENLGFLVKFLESINEPSLETLLFDVTCAVLEDPRAQTLSTLQYLFNMIENLPPDSDVLLKLIPIWYGKARKDIKLYAPPGMNVNGPKLNRITLSSSKNMIHAIDWIQGDLDLNFKKKVIDSMITDEAYGALCSLSFNDTLSKIWPSLDLEVQKYFLIQMADSEGAICSCRGFLTDLLKDPKSRPNFKHLAYFALLLSGAPNAVDPLLEYMTTLKPEECEGRLQGLDEYDSAIQKGILNCKNKLKSFYQFPDEARQKLCLGILALPDDKCVFQKNVVNSVMIRGEEDLEALKKALKKPLSDDKKKELVWQMLDYLYEQGPDGKEAGARLLKDALHGKFSTESGWSPIEKFACEKIAGLKLIQFIDDMGEIVKTHKDMDLRVAAVRSLGSFQIEDTVPYLLEALRDPEQVVRALAKESLNRMREYEEQKKAWEAFKGTSTTETLLGFLKHENPQVRLAAIKSLGKTADTATLPILVELIANGTEAEKEAATKAVDLITKSN